MHYDLRVVVQKLPIEGIEAGSGCCEVATSDDVIFRHLIDVFSVSYSNLAQAFVRLQVV